MKNILFIFVDQWRGDCLGAADHPDVLTPNLDSLAEEGILFNRAYAAAPSCIPARACVATGKTPNNTGFIGYQDGVVWDYKRTMMSVLRDNGYQTINVGKTHFYPQRAHLGFEINHMYDAGKVEPSFQSDYHIWLKKETNGNITDTANDFDGNSYLHYNWDAPEYLHPTAWNTNQAIHFLKNRDITRPFFMQVTYHRPHPPYDPPKSFFDLYKDTELADIPYGDWCEEYGVDTKSINAWCGKRAQKSLDRMRKAYYGSISHVDYSIGKIITWLKSNNLYDDTLIVFTSDHGELLGDHHMFRKISPFEGSAKLPFILKPVNNANVNIQNNTPISHYDIMPTFLDYANIAIPEDVDGTSLMPLLCGKKIKRDYIHGEHCGYGDNGWQFIVDENYKYIWNTKTGKEYFFNLKDDSKELMNLAYLSKYNNIISIYREKLIHILKKRPQDNLVENDQLKPGTVLNPVREEFLLNSERLKKEYHL